MADQQPPSITPSTNEPPSTHDPLAQQEPSTFARSSIGTEDQQSVAGTQTDDGASKDPSGKSGAKPDTVSEDGNGNHGSVEEEGELLTTVWQHFDNKIGTHADFPLDFYGPEDEAFAKVYWNDPHLVATLEKRDQAVAARDSQQASSSQVSSPLVPPLTETIADAVKDIKFAISEWEAKGTEPKFHIYRFETVDDLVPDRFKGLSFIFVPGHGRWKHHEWSSEAANKLYERINAELRLDPNSLAKKLPGLRPV